MDSSEVKKVSSKFRLSEKKVAHLTPLTAICRFGKQAELVEILPYYRRIAEIMVSVDCFSTHFTERKDLTGEELKKFMAVLNQAPVRGNLRSPD